MLSWLQHRWTGLYLLLLALGALCLFLYGFFPLKYHTGKKATWDDLPKFISGVSIDGQEVYNPGATSVVLIVIDGIRYDFVTADYMPYTGGMVENKTACLYVSVAEPPTVTMPRIKAMMTGSVSTFADVALNFGAPAVKGDSVLRVANATGKRSVMYGDDTWLRLFPGLWAEHDGTTSFYVTDYTEVDNNVTRHLDTILTPDESGKPKFDFLVLHYLGLDHIGHLEGARSPKIAPKLIEMDDVVKKVHDYMKKWDRPGVLFVCGDHGMRDAGGHGGSTPSEVLVPLVVTKTDDYQCPYDKGRGGTVSQVDLAPTIAWLLDSPIPGDSTGRLLPSLLPADIRQHLYLLHYLSQHNSRALLQQTGEQAMDKEYYKQFQRAEKQFAQYLATGQQSAAKIAKEFYTESLKLMSKSLTESTVEFDMFAIVLAILLLYAITSSLVCVSLYSLQHTFKKPHVHYSQSSTILAFLVVLTCVSCILLLSCAMSETTSNLCTIDFVWSQIFGAVAIGFTVTYFVTKTAIQSNMDLRFFKYLNAVDYLLVFGTLFYPWAYVGTSFIEEEHMTWYFFWNMLMCFVLIRTFVVVVMYLSKKSEGATEVQEKPHLQEKMSKVGAAVMPQWVLLIGLHRYLKTMNQTGDRWMFLPDTADWLNAPENQFYLELHLVVGTILTSLVCLRNLKHTNNPYKINTILTILATATSLCYRIATHSLTSPIEEITTWDQVSIVNVFWIFVSLQLVFEIASYIGIFKTNKKDQEFIYHKPKAKTEDYFYDPSQDDPWNLEDVKLNLARSITHLVMNKMMLIIMLLMRPHNIIMVPSIYFTSKLTVKCMDHCLLENRPLKSDVEDTLSEALSHLWIGTVFFFYQGNSNTLSTVDLGSGYVGLSEYCPVRVALRMGLHSYAGPALAGISLYASIAARSTSWQSYLQKVWRTTNLFAFERVYSLVIYLVIATFFRHHIYVWSVFSPKILYDFVSTMFTLTALVTIAEIIGLTHFASWLAKGISHNVGLPKSY